MRRKGVNEFLVQELKQGGLGNDIFKEAANNGGYVGVRTFLSWIHVETNG